jgi:benzoate-CoA ligase family protein
MDRRDLLRNTSLFDRLYQPERAARVAVLYQHTEITYDDLRVETMRVAEALNALNIAAGDRVGILLTDSPEFIAAFVAIISLGAIAVPINLALRREDQLFILKDCGACAAIIEASAAETLFQAPDVPADLKHLLVVRGGSASESGTGVPPVNHAQDARATTESGTGVPPVNHAQDARATTEIAGMEAQAFDRANRAPLDDGFPVRPSEDADAFILYTSGSTGEPKGAVHRQSDIFYTNETFCSEVLKLREGDRLFSSSRLPFAYGLGNSFTFPLLNGFTTILCRDKPAPEIVSRVFQEYRPTIFFGVPVVYSMLLEHHRNRNELDTSSLRLCVSAGEALPAQLGEDWEKTFGVEVLDGIGSTEMLHMFMSNHERDVRYGSSGKLLGGYEARLIDHEGNPTPAEEAGNLWIRGDSAALRYWQRPETTSATFVDGWVRTGDLYVRDADEFWWHMGRSDDCFKPTGQWVSPVEVENVLLRHEAVRAAAVVEGFDEHELSCVCAFVVMTDETNAAEQELRALCEGALPRFKQPRRYLFVSELPYTATGKVQRFKLREQLRSSESNL